VPGMKFNLKFADSESPSDGSSKLVKPDSERARGEGSLRA
jgi:hypothetical protein